MSKSKYTSSQKAQIKEFRHNIAVLKRKGLVNKSIDARSIKPTKHYKSVIKDFKQVLEGTATAVKLNPKLRKQYKAVGYKGAYEKVIIPHREGEKVIVTHGLPKTTNLNGIIKMDIPIAFHDIEQYLRDLKKQRPKKRENERFGFRFFGNNSRRTYDDFDDMITDLQNYKSVLDAINTGNPEEAQEIIDGLTWFRVGNRKAWKKHYEQMATERENRKRSERRQRYNERMRNSPTQSYLAQQEKERERSRIKYARMTTAQKEKRKKQMREYKANRKKKA